MSGFLAGSTALMKCSFGIAPAVLNVLPLNKVFANVPLATIIDNKPIISIPPFGMCITPSNPAVSAIIASTLGAVTQAPCVPCIAAPWVPTKPNLIIGKMPCVMQNAVLICNWGGVITMSMSGQMKVLG